MPRYEITGSGTCAATLSEIQAAARDAGAVSIRARCAYGWRNQPLVATFRAPDDTAARRIADSVFCHFNGAGLGPMYRADSYCA